MGRNVKEIISKMTLEEKAGMCSGEDFWHLKSIERLGIPAVMVSDGPHGLRKQAETGDHLGINDSILAVCFPTACATACSFDRDMMEDMGRTIGDECQAENVSVILGPAVNIKRSPLCGRNFEYFSEDPYLAGQISAAFIKGVESKNVGTSIKHFAANNQEHRRMSCSSEVDERTLREIYLAAFETPIKEGKPDTVMCSYNRINGEFASENHWLLTEVLRDEWGFEGYVVSDWGAVNERVKGLKAGLDLEMPASGKTTDKEIVEAVKRGSLDEKVLDLAVERILNVLFHYVDHRQTGKFDREEDHKKARKIARESMVLLKNEKIDPNGEEKILPLKKQGQKIAFIGHFAKEPRYQGGGSSHINSSKVVGALEASKEYCEVTYAQGYIIEADERQQALEKEAIACAKAADVAVIFAGLPDAFESEGYDRTHMRMPKCQDALIEEILKIQPNVVVVLHNGSPVEMPWAGDVKGILESYLCGQAVGEAQCDILFGDVSPCGKLAETIPIKLSDNPSYLNFPGDGKTVDYKEGIFVGYRYYDTKEIPVRFPFGYGLSYTDFSYSNMRISSDKIRDCDILTVKVNVKNTGVIESKEIVQLYVADHTKKAIRPVKELKGFEKISLKPGEEKEVTFTLDKRSFAWYNTVIHDWYAASGTYEIMIGKSSAEIVLSKQVELESTVILPITIDRNTTVAELSEIPALDAIMQEYQKKFAGAFGAGEEKMESEAANEAVTGEMLAKMLENSPLRTFRSFMGMTNEQLDELIEKLRSAV